MGFPKQQIVYQGSRREPELAAERILDLIQAQGAEQMRRDAPREQFDREVLVPLLRSLIRDESLGTWIVDPIAFVKRGGMLSALREAIVNFGKLPRRL